MRNVGVNRKTGVRDILQGPNQPPSFDIKGAKGPDKMSDVKLPNFDRKPKPESKPESKPETKPEGRRRSKGGTKTGSLRKGNLKFSGDAKYQELKNKMKSGENIIKKNRAIDPIVVDDKDVPDKIKGKITKGGKGGALSIGGALSKAPLRTAGLAALGTQLPKLGRKLKGIPGVRGGKAIRVSAGK